MILYGFDAKADYEVSSRIQLCYTNKKLYMDLKCFLHGFGQFLQNLFGHF